MDAVVDDSDLSMAIYRSASPETRVRIQAQYEEIKARQRRVDRETREAEEKSAKERREQQDKTNRQLLGFFSAFFGVHCLFATILAFSVGYGMEDQYWVPCAWATVICFVFAAVCYFDLRF